MLERARGGLERRRSDSGRPVLGHHEPMRAEGVRAARQGSQVLGIRDAVEQQEEGSLAFRPRRFEKVAQLRVVELGYFGADALMHASLRSPRQFAMRRVLDVDAGRRGGFESALSGVRATSVAAPLEQHADDFPRTRLQGLENGVQSVDEPAHSTTTATATSRFCRSHSFSVQMKNVTWARSSSLPACLPTNGTSNSTPFASDGLASARPSFC